MFLPESFYRDYERFPVPWGPLGWVVHKRTYARPTPSGRLETYAETVKRQIEAIVALGCPYDRDDAREMHDHMFHLRALYSGRALWQLGTPTVERLGGASINNCYMTVCDHYKVFGFAMDMLMLGGGVGMNVQREYVDDLPFIIEMPSIRNVTDNPDTIPDYLIEDSREGWVAFLLKVLRAYMVPKESFTYSTELLRPRGAPIRGFGGKASGPEPLIEGIEMIRKVLDKAYVSGGRLTPTDCGDILCIIGWIVVSGNVRRSAIILMGDSDDKQFLKAKRGEDIPFYRAFANYSVVCEDIDELGDEFWEGYEGEGEPYGLINLALARVCGRIHDYLRPDPGVNSVNPCAEVTGAAPENTGEGDSCNLAEIVLGRVRNLSEFCRIIRLLYPYQKTVANLDYHWEHLKKTVHSTNRLGMSVTGVFDFLNQHGQYYGGQILEKWLSEGYSLLDATDKSQTIWPRSIKLTSVQPSGTKSLMSGSSPGAHPDYAPHCIRRVRLAVNDPLVPILQRHGVHVEPAYNLNTIDPNTLVASFPVAKQGSLFGGNVGAVQQLELVKFLNKHWADNSTSCTVYFRPEELKDIKRWLRVNYKRGLKTVSFLKYSGHGFRQAPYEPIDPDKYEEMRAAIKPIPEDTEVMHEDSVEFADMPGCEKGVCPPR